MKLMVQRLVGAVIQDEALTPRKVNRRNRDELIDGIPRRLLQESHPTVQDLVR